MPDPINPISIVDGDTHINKYPGKKIYIGGNEYLPVGTVLMYNGSGIADAGSRSTPLGDETGDTIKMPGWYVCNGNASTPNLLNKFVRAEAASGNTGGEDTHALIVDELPSHNHGGNTGYTNPSHSHTLKYYGGSSGGQYGGGMNPDNTTANAINPTNINHRHTIPAQGSGTAHENKPAYYSLIFIIRMT